MSPAPLRLVAEALACARGGRLVFEGVSFSLQAGEMMLVTGRNGAGKSSLLRLIAGLVRPEAGAIRLDGGEAEAPLSEAVHYAGHADGLKPALTGLENLAFWQRLYGRAALSPEAAMDRFAIAHLADLPVSVLSAGQKRRLTLARLLVSRRPVWLLDEPTSALDRASQAILAAVIAAHLGEGGLVVAATHAAIGVEPAVTLDLAP